MEKGIAGPREIPIELRVGPHKERLAGLGLLLVAVPVTVSREIALQTSVPYAWAVSDKLTIEWE